MNNNLENKNNKECLIFPFGCNSSQYKAVLNAINNKLSVIEGPPGTGKTQTIAKSIQMKDELSLEYKYYKEDINVNNKKIVNLNKVNETKLPKVWSELLNTEKISIWSKIKYVFVYKVGTLKFYKNELNVVIDSIQNELYKSKIKLLERNIKEEKEFVNNNKSFEKEFTESSMDYLKKFLSIKYATAKGSLITHPIMPSCCQ